MDLYSINVPVIDGVGGNKVMYTEALQNYWRSGSSFIEVEAAEDGARGGEVDGGKREEEIRQSGEPAADGAAMSEPRPTRHKHRQFKWAPKFADIHSSIEDSEPGNDGWALREGYTR